MLLALLPVVIVAVWVFSIYALTQIAICVVSCVVAEALFTMMRGRSGLKSVADCSAVVTGIILALSVPWNAPWYVLVIASAAAMGVGKIVFGGLGQNIFNPAMVGRAFVMIGFAWALGASSGVINEQQRDADYPWMNDSTFGIVSQATPMTQLKIADNAKEPKEPAGDDPTMLWHLFWGNTNGSVGETGALACLIGGLFLCIRRTAAWQIPAGALVAVAVIAGLIDLFGDSQMNTMQHLLGGGLLLGAFFILTDPATSPLTPKARFIYGLGFGVLVMLIRKLSSYPEGVMFAVLLMNALVPLINRWTIPKPLGGPVPAGKKQ